MPKIIVFPTSEDQAAFRAGKPPENHFEHGFETDAEASAYVDGLEAVGDLVEHEILEETELTLEVDIDGDVVSASFASVAEKQAYAMGLDDGDGFVAPQAIRETDAEFDAASALLPQAPVPG